MTGGCFMMMKLENEVIIISRKGKYPTKKWPLR